MLEKGPLAQNHIEDVSLVEGLKYNLLIVSQLCDKNRRVIFEPSHCIVQNMDDNETLFIAKRIENVYLVDLNDLQNKNEKCLVSIEDNCWLWHRRLGHASMNMISKLSNKTLCMVYQK